MTASDDDAQLEDRMADAAARPDDLAILNSLRAYYDESDPVPDGLVDRIQFELTLDALHAEIATLTQLDLAASGARGRVDRGGPDDHLHRRVADHDGHADPAATTARSASTAGPPRAPASGSRSCCRRGRETLADEDGRFVFEDLPSGLAKFASTSRAATSSTTVLTPTIELVAVRVSRRVGHDAQVRPILA